MTSPGRISIVVPCHNAQPFLAQTLGSALEQTRSADEIIVVDDGSTDESLELATRIAEAMPDRIRVYSEHSGQASRSRNMGALMATGDALLFLDADDVLGPDALATLLEALRRAPDGVAISPWFRLTRADRGWMAAPPSCRPRQSGQHPLDAWLSGWYAPPCAVLWSRAAFDAAGRWDERWNPNDDGDLMMRALALGVPLAEAPSGHSYYRRVPGAGSLSAARHTREGLRARLRTIRKIAALLEESGRLEAHRDALRTALRIVAGDAGASHPELADEARRMAGVYRPSFWTRACRSFGARTRRLFDRRRAAADAPAREPSPAIHADGMRIGEVVRYGLERAAAMLDTCALSAPAGAPGTTIVRPTVSVVIPTYNRARLLARALDSVLHQTWADFEMLIVDDGSTDGTAAVVAARADARVRYLRQPANGGVSAARNRGLREARGEFIAFLDSDDEWFPAKLERQLARFRDLPDTVGLLYGGVENEDEHGRRRIKTPAARGDLHRDLLVNNVIHGTSGVMIRRNVVATVGFFDEGIPAIEDYDYWVRVARFFEVEYVAEPLIRYHEPANPDRKSLNVRDNLAARHWFFRKHAAEMRRAGVAHLFLLKTAHRARSGPHADWRVARRLAALAVLEAPYSRTALAALVRILLMRPEGGMWTPRRAAVR